MLEVKWPYPTMDDWQIRLMQLVALMITFKDDAIKLRSLVRNFILLCGRQVGKSEIVAKAIAELLLNVPKIKLLIVSGVERQASGLYTKVLRYIEEAHPKMLKKGKDKPLKTILKLKNGSELITEPVGNDGAGARQHTLNGVIFEEMQLIPEEAFSAITPMLFTTNGFIWMLGTAWADEGYCYERLADADFHSERINAEEVAEKRPEPNRTMMLEFLEKERKRLTADEYAREYLAIPAKNTRRVFPDVLIERCRTAERPNTIRTEFDFVCGVDPAGLGTDQGSISIFYTTERDAMIQTDHIITEKLYTTQTTEKIVFLENQYNFEKIYVDDGGIGFGVFSELLNESDTKYKTIALNNSARPTDYKDEKSKRILGDEMIYNLLNMMEKGKISFLKDPEIRESLASYRFEKDEETKKIKITSNYNHPVQSIMRAAWHLQRKDLKLQIHSIKV